MRKTLLPAAVVALALVAGPAVADDDAHMQAARDSLRSAREHLKAAGGGYDGHRAKALERVDNALTDVNEALKVSEQNAKKDEKKAGQIDQHIQKLEKQKEKLEKN